jgi:hypothetical protein
MDDLPNHFPASFIVLASLYKEKSQKSVSQDTCEEVFWCIIEASENGGRTADGLLRSGKKHIVQRNPCAGIKKRAGKHATPYPVL